MFQLTNEEVEIMVSQNAIPSKRQLIENIYMDKTYGEGNFYDL